LKITYDIAKKINGTTIVLSLWNVHNLDLQALLLEMTSKNIATFSLQPFTTLIFSQGFGKISHLFKSWS
jgi:hypothetical protein